ncbi:MAG TPA: hypothetical protein VIG40_03680 [Tissierellaceae bacterium]
MSRVTKLNLTNDKPKIIINNDIELEIDDSKNNVLSLMDDIESFNSEKEVIEGLSVKLFGEEGQKKIEELNLSISNYMTIIINAMALILDVEVEEIDKLFRKSFE